MTKPSTIRSLAPSAGAIHHQRPIANGPSSSDRRREPCLAGSPWQSEAARSWTPKAVVGCGAPKPRTITKASSTHSPQGRRPGAVPPCCHRGRARSLTDTSHRRGQPSRPSLRRRPPTAQDKTHQHPPRKQAPYASEQPTAATARAVQSRRLRRGVASAIQQSPPAPGAAGGQAIDPPRGQLPSRKALQPARLLEAGKQRERQLDHRKPQGRHQRPAERSTIFPNQPSEEQRDTEIAPPPAPSRLPANRPGRVAACTAPLAAW